MNCPGMSENRKNYFPARNQCNMSLSQKFRATRYVTNYGTDKANNLFRCFLCICTVLSLNFVHLKGRRSKGPGKDDKRFANSIVLYD